MLIAAYVQHTEIEAVDCAVVCHKQSVIGSHPDQQIVTRVSKSGPVWNFDLIDKSVASLPATSAKKDKMEHVFVLIAFVSVV